MDRTSPSPKYIATLALVSSAILIVGWLVRPREVAQGAPPLPSESELAQLARRAERRSLDSMASYFAGAADDVEASIVRLPGLGASGVAWDSRTIVTAPLARSNRETVGLTWSSGEDAVQPFVWGPRLLLAAMSTGRGLPGLNPARRAPTLPPTGSWIIAVWRPGRERAFAPGTYLQSVSVSCGRTRVQEIVSNPAPNRVMAGGGLFDIDGGLLGVILPCGDRFAIVDTASIDTILAESDTLEQRVLARYGIAVNPPDDETKELLGAANGMMVREVWTGYRGDVAGLEPGDIIVAIDDVPVTSLENLTPLERPPDEDGVTLTVRRGSKPLSIGLPSRGLPPAGAPAAPTGSGVNWPSASSSYPIESVVPGSRAAAAGIEAGDRLLRINRAEPRSLTDVRRALTATSSPPMLLEIEREGRRVAVILR